MSSNKVTELILGVLFIGALISLFRELMKLNESTKTKLYDDEALEELNDKVKREKIEDYIDEYHETGKWNKAFLK
jgi:hypothetical protein